MKMRKKARKLGRPVRQPNSEERAQVIRLRLVGYNVVVIAAMIGCHEQTLRRLYGVELEHSTRALGGNLAAIAYEKALGGDTVMLQFVLRTRFGWADRKQITGTNGAPLVPEQPPILRVEYVDPTVPTASTERVRTVAPQDRQQSDQARDGLTLDNPSVTLPLPQREGDNYVR